MVKAPFATSPKPKANKPDSSQEGPVSGFAISKVVTEFVKTPLNHPDGKSYGTILDELIANAVTDHQTIQSVEFVITPSDWMELAYLMERGTDHGPE